MRLGLGCVSMGSVARRRVGDDIRLVRAAIDLGVTVFDTADVYGGGASEHVLGRAVRGRRDEVVIATKGGFVFRERPAAEQSVRRHAKAVVTSAREGGGRPPVRSPSGSYAQQDFSPQHLRNAVQASLRRLRTDRIDVYQLHSPPDVMPDLLEQLSDLVAVGDVARFGVGADSVAAADAWMNVPGISVVQLPFGIVEPQAASTTFALAREHGTDLWAHAVLGGGLLRLADRDPAAMAIHPKSDQVDALRRIAADAGLDQYQLAFGFVRAHASDVSTVLVGSTSLAHLRRDAELLARPSLDEDVLRAVRAAASPRSPADEQR